MSTPNTVILSNRDYMEKEAMLNSSTTPILPGMFIEINSSGKVIPASLTAGRMLIAIEQPFSGRGINSYYNVTNEVVEYASLLKGEEFYGRLKAGHTTALDSLLAFDGSGGLQVTLDETEACARALEVVDNSAGSSYKGVRAEAIVGMSPVVVLNPPAFSSAEVGTVAATTVVVTFSVNVKATDYKLGVTIKKGGVAQAISSGTRQADHKVVRYIIPAVANGDVVTWEYSATTGVILAESDDSPLPTTAAQAVTNNVP